MHHARSMNGMRIVKRGCRTARIFWSLYQHWYQPKNGTLSLSGTPRGLDFKISFTLWVDPTGDS
jgi:hypothetical protein